MIPYILLVIILVILAYIVLLAIWLYLEASQELAEAPKTKVYYRSFDQIAAITQEELTLEAQSVLWRKEMEECGQQLQAANVGLIVFSHGTFVGDDPFGMELVLESLFPNYFRAKEVAKIRAFNHSFWSAYLNDKAYFNPKYVNLFEAALAQGIPCHNFSWSSGNYHAARLSGALKLLNLLQEKSAEIGQKRVLLIGHSHAGQVFALAAHLILNTAKGLALKKLIQKENLASNTNFNTLKAMPLDFVMLGTPYLYPWPETKQYRVIHLINHRNHPYLGGTPNGFFHTRDGDYLQQWGVAGSDFIATTEKERRLNQKLSPILGDTTNRIQWKDQVLSRLRVPPYGETYLVDYKDDSQWVPNWMTSIFGHGIYTEYQAMLFNTHLICEALYNPK